MLDNSAGGAANKFRHFSENKSHTIQKNQTVRSAHVDLPAISNQSQKFPDFQLLSMRPKVPKRLPSVLELGQTPEKGKFNWQKWSTGNQVKKHTRKGEEIASDVTRRRGGASGGTGTSET